jgi:hypothetical protein
MSFLLAGCFDFGGGTPAPAESDLNTYDTNILSIGIPKSWDVLEQDDFTSEVPQETLVVFRNNIKNETFTANINIVRKRLLEPLSSKEFAVMTNNRQREGLPDYNETSKDEFTVQVGDRQDDTYLVGYEARRSPDERLVKYLQIYAVKDNFGYIVTGAFSPQESTDIASLVTTSVKSFKLK